MCVSIFFIGDDMDLQFLLSFLQDAAQQHRQYDMEYLVLRRKTEHSYRAFWDSLTRKQKKLYLRYEADSNAQSAAEEDQLVRQTFLLTRELYR